MGVKEDLGDTRPYWKVLVSLVFSLTATVLFIYVGIKAIFYFMPFVIGWILSVIAGPLGDISGKEIKDYETVGLGNYHYSGTCVVYRFDLSDH